MNTTIDFQLADNIQDEILDYARMAVVKYCEDVEETFQQFFEDNEMDAVDRVIEDCFNGNDIDMVWWDNNSYFFSPANQREICRTYGWVRQTGRERFGDDYDIPDKCYDNPVDFMILVAYLFIIENTDVVEELIREFYEEHPSESEE